MSQTNTIPKKVVTLFKKTSPILPDNSHPTLADILDDPNISKEAERAYC